MDNILTKEFVDAYKNKLVPWGFNGLGYIVYKRTYARVKPDKTTEEWYETVARCVNGAQALGAGYTQAEAERLYDLVFNLKCCFAGRMLWQLGTNCVEKFGANSLLNCWFTRIAKPTDFSFLFENLMLGGGVGFSIRREDVYEFPRVLRNIEIAVKNTKDADFIVPDSREGWISLFDKVMESYFNTGKSFSYSTVLIRPSGEPISGFGGTASGPKVLEEGISKICAVLKSREGKKIRSIDALDVCNIIGSIVVAGNVRRSAQISLGDPDDVLFLKAKRWDLGNIPNWRAMSNNTIYADDYDHIMETVWDGYSGNGEPYGFFNLALSQTVGRLCDKIRDNAIGLNPCAEITLADKECCNLSEIFLNNISSKAELMESAKLLYKTQKAINQLHFIHSDTEKIVHKNSRIGLGVGGICQALDKVEWLDECYNDLKAFDIEWSREKGWNESIKLTTVKPSGTISLLSGSTPGIHPAVFPFYSRTVRMAATDALVNHCKNLGFKVEFALQYDGTLNRDTCVVYFPCKTPKDALVAKDVTAVTQLELVKKLQTVWADNAVSCTVYYRKEELAEIKTWLRNNYKSSIKSVSFLLHKDHNFKQAPYIEITEGEYAAALKNTKPIQPLAISGSETLLDNLECASGSCPIK